MYYILAVISIILLLIAIYKLKFPFWSRQPVFHFHNLKYWIIPPGIIQHGKPEKDKYYDPDIYFDSYFNTPTKKKHYSHISFKVIFYRINTRNIILLKKEY